MPKPAIFLITDEQRFRWMAATNNMDVQRELQMLPPLRELSPERVDIACGNIWGSDHAGVLTQSLQRAVAKAVQDELLFGVRPWPK